MWVFSCVCRYPKEARGTEYPGAVSPLTGVLGTDFRSPGRTESLSLASIGNFVVVVLNFCVFVGVLETRFL